MRVEYLSSYDRSFKKLSPAVQDRTIEAIDKLLTYFQSGQKSIGLGLRLLRPPYWEIRAGLSTRIIFRLEQELVIFVLIGDHNDIRRFLRQ